jgi:(p)ppGpp synthase/HD superfamily hydrolase
MTVLGDRYRKALVFSFELHQGQTRKVTGVPAYSHLLSVSALVLEAGGSEDEAIAALLHDGPEDCGGSTRTAILAEFGPKVLAIVDGCTEQTQLQPTAANWAIRKKAYINGLRGANVSVLRVSLADKLHNLRTIVADHLTTGPSLWQHFKGGKSGLLWFYGSLDYRELKSSAQHSELKDLLDKVTKFI